MEQPVIMTLILVVVFPYFHMGAIKLITLAAFASLLIVGYGFKLGKYTHFHRHYSPDSLEVPPKTFEETGSFLSVVTFVWTKFDTPSPPCSYVNIKHFGGTGYLSSSEELSSFMYLL